MLKLNPWLTVLLTSWSGRLSKPTWPLRERDLISSHWKIMTLTHRWNLGSAKNSKHHILHIKIFAWQRKNSRRPNRPSYLNILVCMDPGSSVDRREKQHADVFRAAYFIQTPGSVSHSLHLFYCPSILNTHTLRHKELFIEPVFLSICRFSQPSPSEIYVKRCVHKLLQYVL